ncbi:MAG: AhpC/TSA family protein [Gammaproteobacteria bacterium]|nr:AhpC/TSA family protein [Gammaproteobacteria bacterium]
MNVFDNPPRYLGVLLLLVAACSKQAPPAEASADQASAAPTLAAKLEARKAESANKATTEKLAAVETAVSELAASGILERAVKEGDIAPNFTLPNAVGNLVTLYEQLEQGPVILTWYRGSWCPYCNLQLHDYQMALHEIHASGAQLLAVSPELPDSSISWKEKEELDFVVLSDVENKVAREYGIVYRIADSLAANYSKGGRTDLSEYNGDDSLELPLAVTYVIGTDCIVEYAFLNADYRKRAETSEIVDVVAKLAANAK